MKAHKLFYALAVFVGWPVSVGFVAHDLELRFLVVCAMCIAAGLLFEGGVK